ncbi:MAG: acetoacetyl-CoA reductase [Gammaproteobacteria bacterium]|nr:acetoacetyl-CoA reductase [Gammaproteobacteria bacterium]
MTKRVALVTGGIGGIGTDVCRELCRQGRAVVAGHLPNEAEQAGAWRESMRTDGHEVDVVPGDVSDFESSATMIRSVEERHGLIEILVNCAGITRDKTLRKMTPEDWKAVINTNLDSVFNVTRNVINNMLENGFGRIVNISSVNGQKGQFGQTNYSAAKAGVHGFTMALAQEVASKGITVNTVSPGYVDTPMTEEIPEDIKDQIVGGIPMRRMATAGEIAQAVGFLCEDRTDYITGANLPVNGGMYMS